MFKFFSVFIHTWSVIQYLIYSFGVCIYFVIGKTKKRKERYSNYHQKDQVLPVTPMS